MKTSELQKGQIVLVMRYSDEIQKNCILLHRDILMQTGYCWYGKVGMAPSEKTINPVMNEGTPVMILYNRKQSYLCEIEEVVDRKPSSSYPKYYDDKIFMSEKAPQCYFKITSIEEIATEDIARFGVKSSGSNMLSAMKKSMVSFSLGVYMEDVQPDIVVHKEKKPKKNVGNECIYRKNEKCNLRTCVNYQYFCERPSTCSKRK